MKAEAEYISALAKFWDYLLWMTQWLRAVPAWSCSALLILGSLLLICIVPNLTTYVIALLCILLALYTFFICFQSQLHHARCQHLKNQIILEGKRYSKGLLEGRRCVHVESDPQRPGIYRVIFSTAPGHSDAELDSFLPVIASDLGALVFKLADERAFHGQVTTALVYRDVLALPLTEASPALEMKPGTSPHTPCCIGINRLAEPVKIPLYAGAQGGMRIAIAGRSGSGKNSPVTQIVLHAIACEFQLWLVDPKQTELSYAESVAYRYESDADRIVKLLMELESVMKIRQRKVKESGYSCWQPEVHGQLILCVMDEFTVVTQGQCSDKSIYIPAQAAMTNLAQRSRSAGISLVWITQQLSTNALPTAARANFDLRISMSVATNIDAEMIIPGSSSEEPEYNPALIGGKRQIDGTLSTVGVFCIGGDLVERGRSYYISPQQAKAKVHELKLLVDGACPR